MRLRENGYTAPWTDERCELLRKLWAKGLSASQVAAEIGGITRNAVIGKVCRLGLSGRMTKPKPVSVLPRAPRRKSHLSRNRIRDLTAFEPPVCEESEPEANPVALFDLQDHHCRWPLGEPSHEMLHCGADKIEGHPYCARHCRMAYTTARNNGPGMATSWYGQGRLRVSA